MFPVLLVHACQNSQESGTALRSSKDSISAAIEAHRKELKQYPDSLPLYITLAQLEQLAGNAANSLQTLETLLRKDSTLAEAWYRKATVQLALHDTAAATRSLQKSIQYAGDATPVQLELGFLYADRTDSKSLAIADYLLTQAADPGVHTQARFMKGIYYSNAGDPVKAIAAYDSSIVHDYTFIDAYIEKGILQYQQKSFEAALKTFEQARTISSTHAEAYLWTAKCYEALRNKPEAADYYKKTIGLDDQMKEAADGLRRVSQ